MQSAAQTLHQQFLEQSHAEQRPSRSLLCTVRAVPPMGIALHFRPEAPLSLGSQPSCFLLPSPMGCAERGCLQSQSHVFLLHNILGIYPDTSGKLSLASTSFCNRSDSFRAFYQRLQWNQTSSAAVPTDPQSSVPGQPCPARTGRALHPEPLPSLFSFITSKLHGQWVQTAASPALLDTAGQQVRNTV